MGLQSFDERFPIAWNYAITDVGAYPWHQIDTAGMGTIRYDAIIVSNTDTVDHVLVLGADFGGGTLQVGQFLVPAGAGAGTGLPIELLKEAMPATVTGFVTKPGCSLSVRISEDIATNSVNIFVQGGQV